MKETTVVFAQRYYIALRSRLAPGGTASARTESNLGRRAVEIGLETLELARIHESALAKLGLAIGQRNEIKRADTFFADTNLPIEESHLASRESNAQLVQLKESLGCRTAELARTNRQLQRGVLRHKAIKDAYEKRAEEHKRSLEESLNLQRRLRRLTHRVLAAQETERNKISHDLQDDIAQTLLGINVGLLSLKKQARTGTAEMKQEIDSSRRLVAQSAKSISKVGQKLGRL